MDLKTALYDRHLKSDGKMVPFAGYILPVQYKSGVIEEHMAVRQKAGLFDVSHMGEVLLSGKDALSNINYIFTNDFTNMKPGKVRYSPMCNESGGVVDDLLVYKINDEKFLVVVNASNRHKDVEHIKKYLFGDVNFKDISDDISQLAIQGPNSEKILLKLAQQESIPQGYYSFVEKAKVSSIDCLISRTGYTGEDGFEIYMKNEDAPKMWDMLLKAGEEYGLIPCGLGARDTLRLEAAMPLYGHEMDDTISPLETGLDFGVKMDKADFVGKKGIESKLPVKRKRVGLKVTGRGIIREHQKVYANDKEIGFTTSGTYCPFIGEGIAMAILDLEFTSLDTKLQVDVRGRMVDAKVINLPFYKRSN